MKIINLQTGRNYRVMKIFATIPLSPSVLVPSKSGRNVSSIASSELHQSVNNHVTATDKKIRRNTTTACVEILTDYQNEVLQCVRKRNLHLRLQMSESDVGFHFSLIFCNFTPTNRNFPVEIQAQPT